MTRYVLFELCFDKTGHGFFLDPFVTRILNSYFNGSYPGQTHMFVY